MDRTLKKHQGFTLIELLIVIVVVGLMMGIAMNRFTRVSRAAQIDEDLHSIAAFLKSKRLSAFTGKNDIAIKIDAAGDTVSAVLDPSGTAVPDGSINLKNGIAPAGTTLTINSRGTFSTATNLRLAAGGSASAYSCVDISTLRIRLGEWNGSNCIAK